MGKGGEGIREVDGGCYFWVLEVAVVAPVVVAGGGSNGGEGEERETVSYGERESLEERESDGG